MSSFRQCALHKAQVPEARSALAAYCMQNALIGEVAAQDKEAGDGESVPYAFFSGFHAKAPDRIIDRVYAGSTPRRDVPVEIWDSCMAPITGN